MPLKSFYLQLSLVSIITAILILLIHRIPVLQPHQIFSWISLLFFIFLSIAMYIVGSRSALSSNKNDFTNVVLGFTIGKLFIVIFVVFSYIKLIEPDTKLFLLPFFGIYIIFTVFESYTMIALGKTKS